MGEFWFCSTHQVREVKERVSLLFLKSNPDCKGYWEYQTLWIRGRSSVPVVTKNLDPIKAKHKEKNLVVQGVRHYWKKLKLPSINSMSLLYLLIRSAAATRRISANSIFDTNWLLIICRYDNLRSRLNVSFPFEFFIPAFIILWL